jgi:thymidine phosphorylase
MAINWPELRAAAMQVAGRAYAPYSRLRVGAAGLTADGRVVTGCNVENASFGLTLCAECGLVSALHAMPPPTTDGTGPAPLLIAVAVVAGDGDPLLPCGRCRQLLLEAGGPALLVDTASGPVTLADLLPASFGTADLAARRDQAAPSPPPQPNHGSQLLHQTQGSDRAMPDVVSLIRVKRDNTRPLTDAEIAWLFAAYAGQTVADEQMAALLMAIYFNGLTAGELRAWTTEMIASGETLDLSHLSRPSVDKHSTGGVGDKVSLILAPLVASCGAAVPQLSGRGLGHTGGTLDKLESIPGWRASLSNEELTRALADPGVVIAAAGAGLAPADRRLYALRDVTGTVESIPLIASSIMSKKIAEGTQALVLDVKTGSGAFMRDQARAGQLARTMVALGTEHHVRTRALVTRMDTPLGRAVGNALEVEEAVKALTGEGPDDLMEVTFALAEHMLELAGLTASPAEAIASGRAFDTWQRMIRVQGGDPDAPLPAARHMRHALLAPETGWVTGLDALAVGIAAWRLGAGRARKEDDVSHTAGVRCLAKPGDHVRRGQPILELHADDESRFAPAAEALEAAGTVTIGSAPPPRTPLVVSVISAADVADEVGA